MDTLFAWSDDLSVGIQEIDEQHKVLVGLLNELHTAISGHKGSAECRVILDRLAEYARAHFAVEESLMRVLGYPDYENHNGPHFLARGIEAQWPAKESVPEKKRSWMFWRR